MAIVKMSKFNLIAFESQKSKLLKNLQKFREVSFIDIDLEENMNTDEEKIVKKVVNNEDLTRIDERLNGVENAISLVRKYHVSKKGLKAMMAGNDNYTFEELSEKIETYDWKKTYLDLKKLGAKLNQLNSEISKKYTEIEHISLWKKLDINPADLKKLKRVTGYLGTVPVKMKSTFIDRISELNKTYYEELNETKEDMYYLVISDNSNEEKAKLNDVFRAGSFSVTDLNIDGIPSDHMRQFKEEIEELRNEKKQIKEEIKKYDNELGDLEAVYEYLKNKKLIKVQQPSEYHFWNKETNKWELDLEGLKHITRRKFRQVLLNKIYADFNYNGKIFQMGEADEKNFLRVKSAIDIATTSNDPKAIIDAVKFLKGDVPEGFEEKIKAIIKDKTTLSEVIQNLKINWRYYYENSSFSSKWKSRKFNS